MQIVTGGIYVNQKTGEKDIYLGFINGALKFYSIKEGVIYDILEEDFKAHYKRINHNIKKGDFVRILSRDKIKELKSLYFDDYGFQYTFPASWDPDMYNYCGKILRVTNLLEKIDGRYTLEDLNGKENLYYFDAEMLIPSQVFVRRF